MLDVIKKVTRHRLLRNAAMVALVVPTALLAACASEPAPPPQPVVYQAPPPAPAPVPVVGERD